MASRWVFGVWVLLLGTPLSAQTVALEAAGDTYLKSGSANRSQGDEPILRLRSSGKNRTLVSFDPAAVAAAVGGGSLASASLELFIEDNADNWGSDGRTVDVHRLSVAWTEPGATWNCPDDASPGNSSPDCAVQWAGGTFEEEPADSVLHTNGLAGWVRFDVTEDVRSLLGGAASHGWLVKKSDEGQNGRVDYTSLQGTAGQAPRLVLVVESVGFDEVPPSLAVTAPARAVVVGDSTPEIAVEYGDGGSGVDLGSLSVEVDGVAVTSVCIVGAATAVCEPPALSDGAHTITAQVADLAGNSAQTSRGFELLLGQGMGTATVAMVADAYLRQGQPNQNQGSESILRVRQSGRNRALLRVDPEDLAELVAAAGVLSAHLEVFIERNGNNWGSTGRLVGVHRLTAAWAEESATWNCPADTDPSNSASDCDAPWYGGSFEAMATDTALHANGQGGWVELDVTADVAAFLDGAPYYGWLLKKADEAQPGLVEYTSRQGTPEQGPRLQIVLELPDQDPPATGSPQVVIENPIEGSFTNQETLEVRGKVTGGGPLATVRVNDQPATLDDRTFSITLQLEEGFNTVLVLATDTFGNRGVAGVGLTLDTEPPQLVLSTPDPGQLVNGDSVRVTGEALDSTVIEFVTVEGVSIPVVDSLFTAEVELPQEGPRTITVVASDVAGNSVEISREVIRFSLPEVTITSPADLAIVTATTLSVAGVVSDDVVTVAVNGIAASLAGTSFTADGIPLIEGGNILTATAANAADRVSTATIHVVRDLTPPRVTIHRPLDGSRTHEATISVSGLVNDIVPGTVNTSEAEVTINGIPAEVVNRSFLVATVPLTPGENSVVARAVDASGNVGEDRITVTLDDSPAPRVRIVSGNHQQGMIGNVLPEPLVVELLDADGQPVGGTPVVFRLRGNDGNLNGSKRQMAVVSDTAGRAQVIFSLGTRAGVGNQAVEASAVGFAGPAVFLASALPDEPELVVVDAGGQQVGVAGHQVPRPLIAAVVDRGHNRLEGVPLRFQVVKGQGHFADGSQETVVVTDSDGRAIVSYVLDSAEGIANNAVNASIMGLEDAYSATFVASSRAAGDPASTSISGVVLDNTNVSVAGATLRIKNTALTAVTDAEGQFRLEGVPVGAVQLIVDGSTVNRPGAWPDLEFNLVTIAGRDNTVNMPIFLLPLDLDKAIFVDETRGGTLTLPQIPGFALEITPGSMSFPGGGKSGMVSVTVVHNDKVPMVPNFGQQPSLIVTIQPAGARFDPPARLTLPNVDGLAPGRVTEMYSFDHDLGHFVSIGPATVSDDATVVTSDPGVGIVKAGWHCGSDPETGVCLHECPECQKCTDPPCRCDPEELCSDCTPEGSACDGEGKCKTGRQLIPKICDGLGQVEENERIIECSEVPEESLQNLGRLCGTAMRVTYVKVTHNCDNVDLKGARWHEKLTSDSGCGGFVPLRTSGGLIKEGNLFAEPGSGKEFNDYYFVCRPVFNLPNDWVCQETLTQKIFLDDCHFATKEINLTYSYLVDENGNEECIGDVERKDVE